MLKTTFWLCNALLVVVILITNVAPLRHALGDPDLGAPIRWLRQQWANVGAALDKPHAASLEKELARRRAQLEADQACGDAELKGFAPGQDRDYVASQLEKSYTAQAAAIQRLERELADFEAKRVVRIIDDLERTEVAFADEQRAIVIDLLKARANVERGGRAGRAAYGGDPDARNAPQPGAAGELTQPELQKAFAALFEAMRARDAARARALFEPALAAQVTTLWVETRAAELSGRARAGTNLTAKPGPEPGAYDVYLNGALLTRLVKGKAGYLFAYVW
jgi:hypothetical protein